MAAAPPKVTTKAYKPAPAPRDVSTSGVRPASDDRSRRTPDEVSQRRYGNAEVSRVATRTGDPQTDARRVAVGARPDAATAGGKGSGSGYGPRATKPKRDGKDDARKAKRERHGKPPEATGQAAEAARPDGKGKTADEKKAGDKGKGADKDAKGAPAAGGADDTADAADEKEEGAAQGGDTGEAAEGEAPAAGAEGGGPAAEVLAPPPRPILEATQAVIISQPPLAPEQLERVRSQTGFSVAEHYARVQVHLDRLSARAQSEQLAIVLHIELIESEVRRDLDNVAALIPVAISSGIDTVRGACANARAVINAASKEALKTIEAHATAANSTMNTAVLSSKEAIEKAVQTASPQLRALYEETMTPLRTLLAKVAGDFKQVGIDQGKAMVKKGGEIGTKLTDELGTPIYRAQNEKRAEATATQAEAAKKDLQQAGERAATDVLGQETTFALSFLRLVDPVAVKMEKVATADAKEAEAKGTEVPTRLATDYERARGFVEETANRALKALDAMERTAVKQLEHMGRSLEEMARERRERLCNAILENRAPAAEVWAQQMAGINQLVPPEQIVDWQRLEPTFVEAMASMNALSARQRLEFDAQARAGFDETRAGLDEDRRSVDEAADSYVSAARDTRKQASDISLVGTRFGEGFRTVAGSASSVVGEFRQKAEEKLGVSVEDTRKQMARLRASADGGLGDSLKKYKKVLSDQVEGLEKTLAPTFEQVGKDVMTDLADREGRADRAMDRIGTDETGLFAALHGMTPQYASALRQYWTDAGHAHDLWWWIDDELSGDEYETAFYYLLGDPVTGARYEISASFHWYGKDVAQMESALRALSPKQLDDLRNDPEFVKVKEKLQSSLKGTNLEVTNSLIAGRSARADALRLKEQIEAARAAGNDDKLHDLLADINPDRLPEVRRELADVLAGNKLTEKPPEIEDKEAIAKFTKFVTDDVDVYVPGSGEGDPGYTITMKLSEPSKKLAEALVATGEGSNESRAARLAYETTRGGKPRPERLAKALDDPELTAARKNPLLTKPNADPRDLADAKAALVRLEARRADMLKKFAELSKADEATKRDPKRAQAFAEKAVADMFGGDELGRELGTSMVRDARANPAVAIKFAVRGWGTNEKLIKDTLKGMTREEIEELKKEYQTRFGKNNPNQLFDDLGVFQNAETAKAAGVAHATGGGFFTELSGDDRQEVEELLLGMPKNDRDNLRLARLKYQHQRGEGTTWATSMFESASPAAVVAGGETGPLGSESGRLLDMNRARMEEMVTAAGGEREAFDENGNFKDKSGRYTSDDFRLRTTATMQMAESYKNHIDSLADLITGAIAIIGAIVGTIVVTVLTLGTATPLVIGLWAAGIAAATGAAAMAANYAIKGSRYGWEQAAVDGALTLVDAATAGLMAGAGAKAARAATALNKLKAAARLPSELALASREVEKHAQKELARGFVRSAGAAGISGTARTATADGTWDDGFMTGLGRSVSGGVKAAGIGLVSHGATTAFQRSALGQRLGQSTSYFGRGFGAGLGGAIGGMAGRTSELTFDAVGGHYEGNLEDALASIAAAGGRGFAENFGQGVAEVPKARRDAAQAHLDLLRGKADAERIARFGLSGEDEVASLRFRRMAVEAARLADPKTNPKVFLAELDAAVAKDRALITEHHQLVRDFRREALAAIPPERRGEFADVPIHVLPDAEFERFTGSQSGRAVTIIVDGEPQIVVRKGATPDVMREEGIHVLQASDPRWRERIARLDEKTLSRWNELDLETKLALYREKLEIEINGQQRLRQSLLDEAEGTPDPGKRAALLARADATETTQAALLARRDEVDSIGPDRLERIRRREEEPLQYLREPARLFSKAKDQADGAAGPHPLAPVPEAPALAVKKGGPPPEEEPRIPRSLDELRNELASLRKIAPAARTPDHTARIKALEEEVLQHYRLGSGEGLQHLEARVLARKPGESDGIYRRRLLSLDTEVASGAEQLGRPELLSNYERLLRSLRPLEAVRSDIQAHWAIPRAERTRAQSIRLARLLDELESHYSARPGERAEDVEARLFERAPGESDAQYRERLLSLRSEVEENAAATGRPELLDHLDRLTEQLQRPVSSVRAELAKLMAIDPTLRAPTEWARLIEVERELQSHYLGRPGETHRELEERLFAQRDKETLDAYLERLRSMENEVVSGWARTGSERVVQHYQDLVAEVERDIARRPQLEAAVRTARQEYEHARDCFDLHRRAMFASLPRPNVPRFTETEVRERFDRYVGLGADLKSLATRSGARSARYQFADLGNVEPCFLPGTKVATPEGLRPIETLAPGDRVLARTPTGTPTGKRVVRVHRSATQFVVRLSLAGETILTTRNHPFWSHTHQAWRAACELQPSDALLTLCGPAPLQAVTIEEGLQPTLNLEVDGVHTFLVGAAGTLVHNGARRPDFTDLQKRLTRIYRVVRIHDDGTREVMYIGKTYQGTRGDTDTRFRQHLEKKPEWAKEFAEKTPNGEPRLVVELEAEGQWTAFETAVWEEHSIRKYRLNRGELERLGVDAVDLQNKGVPLTKETFNLHRSRFRGC